MLDESIYRRFLTNNQHARQLMHYDFMTGQSPAVYIQHQGEALINFSSSDCLNLATHPLLLERAREYASRWGVGSGASRLVCGNFSLYESLEAKIAHALKKPACLLLGTGYQANFSVLESLLDPSILGQKAHVFADKLCHVSLLTAPRYLANLHRFRHNDLTHLKNLLEKASPSQPKFIVAESIYSMEGDTADLTQLAEIAKQYDALLYIDDAHAVGLYGKNGWGKTTEVLGDIPFIMGTFSKALGSFGGFVACGTTMKNYFVNKCRGLIYSTGLSPMILGAISAAIDLLPQLEQERNALLQNANRIRIELTQKGIPIGQSTTHIIPWIIGDAKKTSRAQSLLKAAGILGVAIQPPTVPRGKSRIRFCLNVGHGEKEINTLLDAIVHVNSAL